MIINVYVKPNSKKQEMIKISKNKYKVFLKCPARENKANIELVKLMKKYLGKNIKIIKGMKGKNKVLEVVNADKI